MLSVYSFLNQFSISHPLKSDVTGSAGRKYSSSTCQLCCNTSGKGKRGESCSDLARLKTDLSVMYIFKKKPTKNPPQKPPPKTLFCINKFSGKFPFDFIRYRNRPQKKGEYEDLPMCITITSSAETVILAREKRKRINHWISMATEITQGALGATIGPLLRT